MRVSVKYKLHIVPVCCVIEYKQWPVLKSQTLSQQRIPYSFIPATTDNLVVIELETNHSFMMANQNSLKIASDRPQSDGLIFAELN